MGRRALLLLGLLVATVLAVAAGASAHVDLLCTVSLAGPHLHLC